MLIACIFLSFFLLVMSIRVQIVHCMLFNKINQRFLWNSIFCVAFSPKFFHWNWVFVLRIQSVLFCASLQQTQYRQFRERILPDSFEMGFSGHYFHILSQHRKPSMRYSTPSVLFWLDILRWIPPDSSDEKLQIRVFINDASAPFNTSIYLQHGTPFRWFMVDILPCLKSKPWSSPPT